MYRKPRFLELLHEIREQMSRDADYDVELFTEMVRSNQMPRYGPERNIRGYRSRAPRAAHDAEYQQSNEVKDIESPRIERRKRTAK